MYILLSIKFSIFCSPKFDLKKKVFFKNLIVSIYHACIFSVFHKFSFKKKLHASDGPETEA